MRQKSLVLIYDEAYLQSIHPACLGSWGQLPLFPASFWEHRPAEIYDRILLCDNLIDFTINRVSQLRSSTFRGSCFAVFQSPSRFRAILIVIMPTRLLQLSNVWLFSLGWIRKSLIQVQKEKGIFVGACLRPPSNMKLGIFTLWSCKNGNEMYKKVSRTYKVVVLPRSRCRRLRLRMRTRLLGAGK